MLSCLDDPVVLQVEPIVTAITLTELSIGPPVTSSHIEPLSESSGVFSLC